MNSREQYERVVLGSGHMIDAPNRRTPRFPPHEERNVRHAIADVLDEWGVGSSDLALTGAACGTDILFAELCVDRGAAVRLMIALQEEEFLRSSVRIAGSNWEQRYRVLRDRCETWFQHEQFGSVPVGESPFERNNRKMVEYAASLVAPTCVHAVVVWDGQAKGDGPGGTSHFITAVQRIGGQIAIIDPAALRFGNRQ